MQQRVWSFERHCDCVGLLAGSARVAVGQSSLEGNVWDGCVKLLDEASGAELASKEMTCGVTSLCVAGNDDSLLAVARDDGQIHLLSLRSDDSTTRAPLELLALWSAHDNMVSRVVVDGASGRCLSSSWDGGLSLWDFSRAQPDGSNAALWSCPAAHSGVASDCTFAPTGTGMGGSEAVAASVGRDGFLRLWDLRAESCSGICDLRGAASCVAAWPQEPNSVVVGMEDGSVALVDVRGGTGGGGGVAHEALHQARVRRLLPVPSPRAGPCLWLSASDDATILLSSLAGGVGGGSRALVPTEHGDYVTDLAARPGAGSSLTVLSASTDKTLRLSLVAAL